MQWSSRITHTHTLTHANKQRSQNSHSDPKNTQYCLLLLLVLASDWVWWSFFSLQTRVQFSTDTLLQHHAPTQQKWSLISGLLMEECLVINIHVYYHLANTSNKCISININTEATLKRRRLQLQWLRLDERNFPSVYWVCEWSEFILGGTT